MKPDLCILYSFVYVYLKKYILRFKIIIPLKYFINNIFKILKIYFYLPIVYILIAIDLF